MLYETLVIGIILALLYSELMDIYPGGIIVPAYCAFYLDQPIRVLVTIGIAFLCLGAYRLLSRYFILFGKRRFVVLILIGMLFSQIWWMGEFSAIGWIIPGLLANNLEKQKWIPTLASLLTVSLVTYFLVRILVWLGV